MNKRPLILRTLITVVVVLVFTLAIHPLFQRDYYETFLGMLKDKQDPEAHQVVKEAKALQEANPQLYQSQALLQAADAKGLDLTKKVNGNDLQDNRDVMSLIRKNASSSIRLGLDLNGGVEFILQLVPDQEFLAMFKEDDTNAASREEMQARMASEFDRYRDIAIEILRKRLEGQKIFEAEIAPSGSSYVALRAPVVAKDEKLKLLNLIKMSARLNFRLVHENNAELVKQYLADKNNFVVPVGYELLTTSEFRPGQEPKVEYYFVNKIPEMTGKGISNAMATKDEFGQRKIQLRFSQAGAEDFARVTSRNIGRQLAIVLDGNLYCAPVVNQAITGGSAEISGRFSNEEAKSIADALVSGSFPFQIKVDAVFDTDPKLGASNVANGIWVGAISLVLVAIFMCVYYRVAGVISVVALALNVVLILGAMAAFNATLTLPGIAGIILTIGMAVDANVLVFERIREELKSGKSLMNAVDYGYQKAFSAVFDANLTTLITSIILMSVGTGAIKGFAVTLSIGILTSLFTALFVTRLIFAYLFRYTRLSALPMMQFFKKTEFNFNRMWSKAMTISGILILLSIVVFFVRGKSMLGVDFTGGTQVTFTYAEQIPQEKLEAALKKAGYDATVTYKYNAAAATDNSKVEILVRGDLTKANANESPMDHLASLLNKEFPTAKLSNGLESSIGGLIGWEFTKAALLAIAFSIIGIGAYVTLRYEFTYALTSILALLHDVIIVTGIFLALGRTISLTVIAALLTVIGYSINDTVVIFDRIRENASLKTCKTYEENVNLSINQTLNRTMLTSLTTFIVVFVLFLGAGVAINDFVLIMMLGIIVGTYSSVFLAGPMVALMRRMRSKRETMANAPAAEKR
ncbi:protein translocase subunit SecD [uncultured Victivallis sp.]|uniref:protein translocase subunit SecD n=1 Tax=uncultured Victivallis sp. TaxID=354118 RepID=UPI0025F573DB|nr:protein translocase subunit SecD [uncultured Victivallis sp.]